MANQRGVHVVDYAMIAGFRRDTRDIHPVSLSLGAQGVPP
jgi:hypothetical protein